MKLSTIQFIALRRLHGAPPILKARDMGRKEFVLTCSIGRH